MWGDWKNEKDCNPVETVEDYKCGSGYMEQKKRCDRTLGGKYCRDENGEDVREDILHQTIPCQAYKCPGSTQNDLISIKSFATYIYF